MITMMSLLIKARQLSPRAVAVVLLIFLVVAVTALSSVVRGTSPPTSTSQTATMREAPRAVYGRIAAQMGATPPARAAPAVQNTSTPNASPDTSTGNVRQIVNLWNVSASQFEGSLRRALSGRLTSRRRADGVTEYFLATNIRQQPWLRLVPGANKVWIDGPEGPVRGAVQLVHALDSPRSSDRLGVRFVPTSRSRQNEVGRLIRAVQLDGSRRVTRRPAGHTGQHAMLLAAAGQRGPGDGSQQTPTSGQAPSGSGAGQAAGAGGQGSGQQGRESETTRLVGPVQVQVLEGMDALIIRGRPEDVKRVEELIRQIEQYSLATKPAVVVVALKHVDASALGMLLSKLYEDIYKAREGTMSITPLAAPNALLLVGRPESVEKMMGLVERLDQPVSPTDRFQIFRLKHAAAEKAQENIAKFFAEETPEGTQLVPRVHVVADFRSNSLIVRASPRDMAEVAAIIARLDGGPSESFNEVRVFPLKNASAQDLAPVLQDALTGQMYGQRARMGAGAGVGAFAQAQDYEKKSTRLQFITIDTGGRKVLSSGILTDAQVTADQRTNALVVTASADSMPLIAALIDELDQSPSIEAQVKVFTLVNGDATNMTTMLQNIFSAEVAGDEIAVRTGIVEDETSLVGLRFAADVRTNSIIVTGSAGALTVVEAVLARLDGSDARQRESIVYRLRNTQAVDVAKAINDYLAIKREVEISKPGVLSAFEQIDREVIVVAEEASNSLIVSATPRYFKEIMEMVKQIDRRPAMTMIQVVIAEVSLDDFQEFGVELGLEDSILFDRVLATGGLAYPGALFSNTPDTTGGRALTSLATGQLNAEFGSGGLVLNASSESVTALIRALAACRRVKVLSRPQIMALDGKAAQIVVGEQVPFVSGTSYSGLSQQNAMDYMPAGLIVQVTPRVTPDGLVVMDIIAKNSRVGAIEDGIPVSVAGDQVIRSPRIEEISAQTAVSAVDGQTVVLGGLIVEEDNHVVRRVPVLSAIPLVGNLFKYESNRKERKELLIIMTPRIIHDRDGAQRIACIEASRLHWCRSDVEKLHGGYGGDPFLAPGIPVGGPQVIYPDETPTIETMPGQTHGPGGPEWVPTPEGSSPTPDTFDRGAWQGMQQGNPYGAGTAYPRGNQPWGSKWQPMPTGPAMGGPKPSPEKDRNVANPLARHPGTYRTAPVIEALPPVDGGNVGQPSGDRSTSPYSLVQYVGEDGVVKFRRAPSVAYLQGR